MKRTIGPARVASRGSAAFLATALAVFGGCAKKEAAPPPEAVAPPDGRGTHAPPFKLVPDLILQRKADFMKHVAQDLAFDSGPAVDDRRLLEGPPNALHVGPHATLASETGAPQLDSSFDWANDGRVVAKITLDGDYPLLSLKKGLTYVCVVRGPKHQWSDIWAVLVGVANNTVRDTARLELKVKNTTGPARWIVGGTDDNFCVPCDSKYCCSAR